MENKKYKMSVEHKRKLVASHTGVKQTPEHLNKRRAGFMDTISKRKSKYIELGLDGICASCGEAVDKAEFDKDVRYLLGYRRQCRKCKILQVKKSQIKSVFGITLDKYTQIIKNAGKCESCGSTLRLCLDHCHKTGTIRGVLCSNCNTALGLLNDDTKKIGNLINYLSRNH
jgi:hypothetical protein